MRGDVTTVFLHPKLSLRRGRERRKRPSAPWPHQEEALEVFLPTVGNSEMGNCLLCSPTGSGKTLIIKGIAMGWAALGKVVIIAVPKTSIKSSFREQSFLIDDEPQTWALPMNFTEDYRARLVDNGEVRTLKGFVERPADPYLDRRYWVCTHATLLAAFRAGVDFSNAFVVIDEAHHFAAEGAGLKDTNTGGDFLHHMLQEAIPHFLCTATPFRTDNRLIIPRAAKSKYAKYTRERSAHLDDMRHVSGLNTRAVSGDVETILDREFSMIRSQKRKAIVSLPRVDTRFAVDYGRQLEGDHNKETLEEHVIGLAEKHGLDIWSVATDESYAANGQELDRIFTEFRNSPNDALKLAAIPDIVLVQERFKEGTDCAAWSTVIQIGLPGSPVEILQFQGRATRDLECKEGVIVEYVCVIPAADLKAELAFEHTLDTVKSLVLLGFMASDNFEQMTRTADPDVVLSKFDDSLKAMERGQLTPEQRTILEKHGVVFLELQQPPPTDTDEAPSLYGPSYDGSSGGGHWSPAPEAAEPKPLVFLSDRLGLDVSTLSDEEFLKAVRTAFIERGKAIYKGFAKAFQTRISRHPENLRAMVVELYGQGRSLRQIVGDLGGRLPENEIQQHLREAGKLHARDRYRVKPKIRRKRAPLNSDILP